MTFFTRKIDEFHTKIVQFRHFFEVKNFDSLREYLLIRFKDSKVLIELVIFNFVINPFGTNIEFWIRNFKKNSSICRMISNVMPYSPNMDTVHSE